MFLLLLPLEPALTRAGAASRGAGLEERSRELSPGIAAPHSPCTGTGGTSGSGEVLWESLELCHWYSFFLKKYILLFFPSEFHI